MPWAIKHSSTNRLDGHREWLEGAARFERPAILGGYNTLVFATRAEARAYINKEHGYRRQRPDLRREPFGWSMPQVVQVKVRVEQC